MSSMGDGKYILEYAGDSGNVLRETTLSRFAQNTLNNLFVQKLGSFCVINNANESIFSVYGESRDNAGNRIWVKQDNQDFYDKCMEFRNQNSCEGEVCNS